ncbi:GNAT family N-acetyltransferase [Microseira wollei]|uniref:Acetyltransferase, gnat family, putative n=1 Tax=Microseira wollei NIES-4236 TaxID=2530354 RepID=A0AAV3XCS8_9CYAN|nr:GNAT family N-acetyltransferase [Microseira wollei]GET37885.1 acetyltransferase, gnat family, putative [Microseira wollei NIES-4236]
MFSIRQANPEDQQEIANLFVELEALHTQALPNIFRPPILSELGNYSYKIGDQSAVFVAVRDGEIIGVVMVLMIETPQSSVLAPRVYATVSQLIVKQNCRRCGVGRALMEKVHQWTITKGIADVELNIWEFNTDAIAFYEKLGYRTNYRHMKKTMI